jgi:predicted secreted protein
VFRRLAVLSLVTVLSSTAAWSGDAAFLNIIGFSSDRHYFAFEQYGTQDGSAFTYSDIVIIDLEKDQLVKGAPIQILAGSEQESLFATRNRARNRAKEMLNVLKINQPAEIIGSNPITELVSNRKAMAFNLYFDGLGGQLTPPELTKDNNFELLIANVLIAGEENCYAEDGKSIGFSLSVRKTATGAVNEKYRDRNVPASRYCPIDYEIDTIASFRDEKDEAIFVAVIAVYRQGFEGPDRRFIVVPFNPL